MTYQYHIEVRVPLRHLYKTVMELEDSLNAAMQGFGFSEKTVITSILPLQMTVARLLTLEETAQLQELLIEQFTTRFGYAKIEEWTLVSDS